MAGAGRPTPSVGPAEGQAFRAHRLLLPNSAYCTATPVAARRRVIASPLVALASKSAACRMCGAALGLAFRCSGCHRLTHPEVLVLLDRP